MAYSKVILNGNTIMDVTQDTVAANKLLSGETATGANGERVVGTYIPPAGGTDRKQVTFYDYDGTVVESYTSEEAAELTELPSNPTHTGLISQGWNWTLAQIKSYLTNYPDGDVNVGQMYNTASGKTEIDIDLNDSDFLSPYLSICVNGTAIIDWGDGSATDTITGQSSTTLKYKQHVYSTVGQYTISIDGPITLYATSDNYTSLLMAINSERTGRAYSQCITEVRLNEAASLGIRAFNNCHFLQSVTIPRGITSISDGAFYNCYSLRSVTFPNSITSIGTYIFYYCYSLQSVAIPDGVTSIGDSAFRFCYILQSITIPSGVTSISQYAFHSCQSIQSITIPSGVTSIGVYAFNDCRSIRSITIPSGVISIGNYAFNLCYSLQSINIPDGITSIGAWVFGSCRLLQNITIPSGVTSIGTYAFSDSVLLRRINIPSGVTSIGTYAFYKCYSLQSVIIPDGVTIINNNAFSNCYSLRSVTIPDGVTTINPNAFQNCYSVMEYHLLPTTPPTLSSTSAFSGINSETKIYVPAGCLEAYKTAANWSTYASKMVEESA